MRLELDRDVFSHNIANTRHGRHSALTLHSFVRGVLRQLFIGFSPPGSAHMPRYEPPCPKISSKRHFLNCPILHSITNAHHACCSTLQVAQFCLGGDTATCYRVCTTRKRTCARACRASATRSADFAQSGAMDITNTQSRPLQHPESKAILPVGCWDKFLRKLSPLGHGSEPRHENIR